MVKWLEIFRWLLGLFVIYIIIQLVRKILGGSWGYETIISSLLLANLGYVFLLHGKISTINAKLSEHIGWHKGKENLN